MSVIIPQYRSAPGHFEIVGVSLPALSRIVLAYDCIQKSSLTPAVSNRTLSLHCMPYLISASHHSLALSRSNARKGCTPARLRSSSRVVHPTARDSQLSRSGEDHSEMQSAECPHRLEDCRLIRWKGSAFEGPTPCETSCPNLARGK